MFEPSTVEPDKSVSCGLGSVPVTPNGTSAGPDARIRTVSGVEPAITNPAIRMLPPLPTYTRAEMLTSCGKLASTCRLVCRKVHRAGGAAAAERVLWLEDCRTLVAADLHLEKGSAFAARGQLLPPYDTAETLARLTEEVVALDPARILLLGDSFYDDRAEGAAQLPPTPPRWPAGRAAANWSGWSATMTRRARALLPGAVTTEMGASARLVPGVTSRWTARGASSWLVI